MGVVVVVYATAQVKRRVMLVATGKTHTWSSACQLACIGVKMTKSQPCFWALPVLSVQIMVMKHQSLLPVYVVVPRPAP